jgi:hypothetical protein
VSRGRHEVVVVVQDDESADCRTSAHEEIHTGQRSMCSSPQQSVLR